MSTEIAKKMIMKLKNRRKSARPVNVEYCHFFVEGALNIKSLDDLKILIDGSKIYELEKN